MNGFMEIVQKLGEVEIIIDANYQHFFIKEWPPSVADQGVHSPQLVVGERVRRLTLDVQVGRIRF